MKPAGWLAACSLALCAQAVTQVVTQSRTAPGYNQIQAAHLRANLTFLASDALEGRLSLERGSEVAIEWIASEFAKAGLTSAAGDSYLQTVPLIEFRGDRTGTFLTLERAGKSTEFRFPDALGSFPDDVSVRAPVVFAGFGITAPELGYDDYSGIDVHGKIVLLFDHEPQETDPNSIFNGLGNTRYAASHFKVLNAEQHGAVGVLLAAEPNRKHPSNQERIARLAGAEQRFARIPSQALAESEIHIPSFTVSDKLVVELLSASGRTPGDVQSAIDKDLRPASVALGDTVVAIHSQNRERRRASTANVVGLIEGSDPALAAETVIFSAHYDHDGTANGQVLHGADDNASGTAGVVELAHAFARNPIKPRRSLLFVVFAAEERGLLGSYYYVAHPLRPLETTRVVINFDMIGRNEISSEQTDGRISIASDTSNELNLVGTNYSPDYRAAVEQANQLIELRLNYKWDHEASLNVFFRSDQFPFALHGIPAAWWFTGFHPDYHQTTDTAEKINYPKMEKILQLAYMTAWAIADGPKPPKFLARPK